MKCHIVKDLLPEFTEHLCSAETAREIEDHLRSCDGCRQIWEEMKQENEALNNKATINDKDIQPFTKIQKKLKQNRIAKIVAILLLILVCGVFGTLTVGQIFPSLPVPSYDSLMYRFQAKQIAQNLVDGDVDEILKNLVPSLATRIKWDYDWLFRDTSERVTALCEKAFENKNVIISVKGVTYTGDSFVNSGTSGDSHYRDEATYTVELSLQAGTETLSMDIWFFNRSYYHISIRSDALEYSFLTVPASEDEESLSYTIQEMGLYLSYYQDVLHGYFQGQHLTDERISIQNAETIAKAEKDGDKPLGGSWYAQFFTRDCTKPAIADEQGETEYARQTGDRIGEILKMCRSNQFELMHDNYYYNTEEKKYGVTLYWTITDLKGKTCIMEKPFYCGPTGYEPVDDNEQIFADDGFDKELKKQLEQVFD